MTRIHCSYFFHVNSDRELSAEAASTKGCG